jgi:hypothetical protein
MAAKMFEVTFRTEGVKTIVCFMSDGSITLPGPNRDCVGRWYWSLVHKKIRYQLKEFGFLYGLSIIDKPNELYKKYLNALITDE